uniref:Uncharacterized protein n=1 Tax=Rhizophora mucronata TaxID=61149 RepID=A0A2P2P2C8_RHIMU
MLLWCSPFLACLCLFSNSCFWLLLNFSLMFSLFL